MKSKFMQGNETQQEPPKAPSLQNQLPKGSAKQKGKM